jgi:GDP-L-fucose synthase
MKILITGGTGLVGNAMRRILDETETTHECVYLSSKDYDLTNYDECDKCFKDHKPDIVIHLAANVGGLFKNLNYKVDMFETNMSMNTNVLKACHKNNVSKCVSCLSTCIFPNDTTYPIDETMLHNGPPHYSNDAYAYAKRMVDVQSQAYHDQYNKMFVSVIPTNIYGPQDNFHLEDSHVIPALIHQCYLAKKGFRPFIVRGTGKPLRQFIYSDDLAILILKVALCYEDKEPIILSVPEKDEVSIEDVAKIISKKMDYENNLYFDHHYSDGQYKKTANNNKLMKWLNAPFEFTPIEVGLERTIDWFIENYETLRK